ncbi:transcriptional regulator NrdR [Peptococcus simiae]|uniref:Transcriptional repressor NrdR n=1 Tax=Peptococcus simiae TaxID=1643805 RepID=A0ABW9GX88_9FIRM
MKCPKCGHNSRVLDTRTAESGDVIRRRRECTACHNRFTTFEKIEDMPLLVVKKSGRKELFDASKVMKGLVKACEKRPISVDKLEKLSLEIEKDLKAEGREVDSARIGQAIMNRLIDLDQVAYVRFASVYKDFSDVETFIKEIENLPHRHD